MAAVRFSTRLARRRRLRILAGCAVAALACGAAQAKTVCKPIALTFDNSDNGSSQAVVIDNADLATSRANQFIDLSGNVELHYGDRALSGGQVHYNLQTHRVSGEQGIQITQADGTAEFAQTFDFDDKLQTGTATGFSALLPKNAKLAAASISRPSATITELDRAIFTPCSICDLDGTPKEPTFSISADHVVRDEDRCEIVYQNAVLRVKGVPILYAPYFAHPDPSVEVASGLLAPRFSQTRRRGLSWEQPYNFVLNPYSDLVLSPQLNTEVMPFLNSEYRRQFYSGLLDVRLGYTRERDFNAQGDKFGPVRNKAYVLADAFFQLTPQWEWGFTAQAAQDRRLFDQYGISDLYDAQGLFLNDDRRLISQIYSVRQDDRSYFSIAAVAFQSLRPVSSAPPDAFGIRPLEDDRTLPIIAPLVEFRYEPDGGFLGGRLRLIGSGAIVERSLSPTVVGAAGIDSRRATVQADWRKAIILPSGLRIDPFGTFRADAYNLSDLPASVPGSRSPVRAMATAGLDISYPLIRRSPTTTTIVEPILQLALSPDTRTYAQIPNEDSVAFDFDQTNLFSPNKFPGYDLYAGGQRINTGVQTTIDWGGGRTLRLLAGRSFRRDADPVFPARTSLNQTSSDWIASVDYHPLPGLSLFADTQLKDKGLEPRRIEAGANVAVGPASGYLRYFKEDQDFAGIPREDVEAAGAFFITPTWGISANAVRDLQTGVWRRRGVGIVYMDDCLRFDLAFQREDNPVLGTRSSQTVLVRLTLATFGDTGYRNYNYRSGTQKVRW